MLALVVWLLNTNLSWHQAAEKSSKQAEAAAESMGAEKFSLKMVSPRCFALLAPI